MATIMGSMLMTATEEADAWLRALREQLAWTSERAAYLALRSTLHALRDSLTMVDAAALGDRLPDLIRGIYYDGWTPSTEAPTISDPAGFLARIDRGCRTVLGPDADRIARAVFAALVGQLGQADVEALKRALPSEIRTLWPQLATEAY